MNFKDWCLEYRGSFQWRIVDVMDEIHSPCFLRSNDLQSAPGQINYKNHTIAQLLNDIIFCASMPKAFKPTAHF